ncbi:MAG: SagB/ThcOx family dehydrogenase [Nitrososphaerales archaeon]
MNESEKVGRRSFIKYASAALGVAAIGGAAYYTYVMTQPRAAVVGFIPSEVPLPEPVKEGDVSVEEALLRRRSIREYTDEHLTLQQVSQLLWAAQGITEPRWGGRTAPSPGPTYPLEVYVVVAEDGVEDLDTGVYHYIPQKHSLVSVAGDDRTPSLGLAALDQEWVYNARINIVISAVFERTTVKYGERGVRYVHMEAGHVGQNIYLEATALGLGTVVLGAFLDDQVKELMGLPEDEEPLYILPVGYPAEKMPEPRGEI